MNDYKYDRKSIRLKGYDYAKAGLYFVTICVQNKQCIFGNIYNDSMHLNKAGEMIEKWYKELENKFNDIKCYDFVIMPNHIHVIIKNESSEHTGSPLHEVIKWLKTMTTNEYIRHVKSDNWLPFDGKLWQRNYYEHIIRDQESYNEISYYIKTNPSQWNQDQLYIESI